MSAMRQRYPEHFQRFGRDRFVMAAIGFGLFALLIYAMGRLGFFDGTLLSGLGRLFEIVGLMLPPDPGSWAHVKTYSISLLETVAIALLGTLSAAVLALPVGLAGGAQRHRPAASCASSSRRSLDTIRSVDILVWALIWINVVGLGPFAGALAIMTADIGSFGKLFSEAIEAADRKPVEGITSAGGSHIFGIRFGILPEVFPVLDEPGALLFRVEHAVGLHHRHRRRGRHRPASRRGDPHARAATNLLYRPDDPGGGRCHRLPFEPTALRHDRPAWRSSRTDLSADLAAETPRYALYCAPRAEEPLARAATQWLGRNAETGQSRALLPVAGIAYERLAAIVADPRLYGFHGTLKAPIALDRRCHRTRSARRRRPLRRDGQRPITVPTMVLAELSDFLALVPARAARSFMILPDRCVVEFDEFRRPADEAGTGAPPQRRASSQRQDDLLVRWGYPMCWSTGASTSP